MRISVCEIRVHADLIQELPHPRLARLAVHVWPVLHQRLGDDRPYRHARVQAGLRVLKDHLHLRAEFPQIIALQRRQVMFAQPDFTGGRRVKAQDRPARGGLAATGFANDAQRLAFQNVE